MNDGTVTRRGALRSAAALALAPLAGCSAGSGGDTGGGPGSPTASTGGGARATRTAGRDVGPLSLRTVATGFDAPLDFAVAPGSGTQHVVDQRGVVSTLADDGSTEPFLDLRDQILDGGERGLLGLAFHPSYADNRKLYVRYSSPRRAGTPASFDHTFVLSEFRASADGSSVDPSTERPLLAIPEPQSNHNAGSLLFGPDGYLYVGVGDGGGGGDVGEGHANDWYRGNAGGNGQDVNDNLLGSVLRIDVDGRTGGKPYGIPRDNPLVGEVGLDEHYAWGFRNPWRMSFDGEDLYVGDVGQNAYEEVDLVRKGGNYGWNVREGTHCYGSAPCPDRTTDGQPLLGPIIEYPHSGGAVSGVAIIGGYVYRGADLPGLAGTYVFGDLAARGRLFVASRPDGDGLWPVEVVDLVERDRGKLSQLLSFGRDADGRLYVLGTGDDGGGVYEVRPGA